MNPAVSNAAFHALNTALAPSLQDQLEEAEYRLCIADHRTDSYARERDMNRWSAEIKRIKALMEGTS